jgi:hypothetical protein
LCVHSKCLVVWLMHNLLFLYIYFFFYRFYEFFRDKTSTLGQYRRVCVYMCTYLKRVTAVDVVLFRNNKIIITVRLQAVVKLH